MQFSFRNGKPAATSIAVLFGAGLLASALVPAGLAQFRMWRQPAVAAQSVQLTATIYGSYDYAFEGTGAWVGNALVSIGGGPAKAATFADRNTSFGMRKNGAIYGTETITLNFSDGSGSFEISATFEGSPAATPNLYNLHEVGVIGNGSGDYAGATGSVSVQGPFLLPDPSVTPGAPPWIAEVHGSIAGLK